MAEAGESRSARRRPNGKGERKNTKWSDGENPSDHNQQRVSDSVKETDHRTPPPLSDPSEREREHDREDSQQQNVAIASSGNGIGRNNAPEELDRPGERQGRLLLDMRQRLLNQRCRAPRQTESIGQPDDGKGSENGRGGADDHDPQYRPPGDAPGLGCFGTLGDTDYEQRYYEAHRGHL